MTAEPLGQLFYKGKSIIRWTGWANRNWCSTREFLYSSGLILISVAFLPELIDLIPAKYKTATILSAEIPADVSAPVNFQLAK
jgi:hypothetical protein